MDRSAEIAQSSTHVSDFVYSSGLVQGRTASQEEHDGKQACSSCVVRLSRHMWVDQILTASREHVARVPIRRLAA